MFLVHSGTVVLVAGQAGERRVARCVVVTVQTRIPLAPVFPAINWKLVRENCARPCCRVVAGAAFPREPGGNVVRVCHAAVLGLVTGIAILRRPLVKAAHMAIGAGNGGVRAGQRESRYRVVERSRPPRARLMANLALDRKSRCTVVWVGGRVVLGPVTGDAGRVQPGPLVVDVAFQAIDRDMRAGERKPAPGVIESRTLPSGGGMAKGAIVRETGRDVVRVLRGVVLSQVAAFAQLGSPTEDGGVAPGAAEREVSPSQRKRGLRMVEVHRGPGGRRVADGAAGGEPGRRMIRLSGRLEIFQMTGSAFRCHAPEAAARVAGHTFKRRMGTGEREPCYRVVEPSPRPGGHAVTKLAFTRRLERLVVDHLRGPEIVQVARYALGAETDEPPRWSFLVAALAIDSRVPLRQRKPVDMILGSYG